MADLFASYEEDFLELKTTLENRITTIPNLDGSNRQSEIQQAESDLQEIEQLIKSMNLRARNSLANQSLMSKIKDYESESSKLKTNLRKATMQIKVQTDRDSLFGGLREEHLSSSMDQRQRLLEATEKLERSGNELKHAIATAEDTVGIGIQVMDNLHDNTQKMHGIKDRLGTVNENLGRAKKIMGVIGRRVVTNKLIMGLIILVLILAICLILYIKFFSDSSSSTPTDTTATSSYSSTSAPAPTA